MAENAVRTPPRVIVDNSDALARPSPFIGLALFVDDETSPWSGRDIAELADRLAGGAPKPGLATVPMRAWCRNRII